MKDLRGKLALVTGAGSGIGRAIAMELARHGANLFLVDICEPSLTEAAAEIGAEGVQGIPCVCDVAQPEEASRAVALLLETWGGLDILVNNAGVAYYGPTERMTAAQWDRVMGVNLLAPIQFTRELLPALLARPEAHILNVCSIGGLVASGRLAAYHASKFGLVGFSEALRAEFGPRGLGVTALCPGLVRTNLFRSAISGRPGTAVPIPPQWACAPPEAVARRAVRAIRRNQGLVLVTPMAHFLWGFKWLAPGLLDWIQRFRLHRRPRPAASAPATISVPPIQPAGIPSRKAGGAPRRPPQPLALPSRCGR
jgi:NAD(P)-dependent dehydrogenase (short-subunit alcohol dehydrogenase family)